ncbi:MAG: FAD-binding oxidoreductase [Gammaproteobacteria bacterium]|nr:FAD-binding oxidoreductase [Gammaproteobacteria bacterium]
MGILYRETAVAAPETPPLEGERRCDVLVVGAGLTGLSTAWHLVERGAAVTVLDAEAPGFGASGRNGGQVNPGLKCDPDEVERHFGPERGRRMNAFAGEAPGYVFSLIERLGLRCEARRNGTVRAAVHPRQLEAVRRTAEQWIARGAPVEYLDREAVAAVTGCERYAGAMLDRRGGDLNPLSLAREIARVALGAGAAVHGDSRVLSLEPAGGGAWRARAARGSVTAKSVVLATNGYTDALAPDLRRSIVPLFGSVAATAPLDEAIAARILPGRNVLYETGRVTVYYRLDRANRLVIGGRGPMREIADAAAIPQIREYARRLWPALSRVAWTHGWGGRLAMTPDHYPHLHELAPGLIAFLGYNGRGVALATAMGAELARRALDPRADLAMPVTNPKSIPLHPLWPLAVKAAIWHGRVSDFLGR